MMRAREDRISYFMQLELEACLEEVRWSITCYNCEVLGCPQEEYPARLLPTLPPNYEDNLLNRLRRAQKGIFPASLKMILNSDSHYLYFVMYHKSQCSPTVLQRNIGSNKSARRPSAIYRRDTPRSLRGQRNSKRRQSRPRSVRDSINPEYRRLLKPIHHRQMRACSRLKPVRRIIWIRMSQARSRRSLRCFINEASG